MKRRIIMHIDADAFFASVEQGFNPRLRGKPVIVGGKADQRGVVHTASYEARALGIRTGMPLMKARSICPDAVFLKGNYEHYRSVSMVFQEVYQKYSPVVEFTSLDDAYLDLTGTDHLQNPEEVSRLIAGEIMDRVGVSVSIGIGSNKVIARIASGLKKPRGIVFIPPGKEHDFLSRLPVDVLPGIGRMAKERLTDLHIFTVGQMAKLSKMILEQLFGKNGIRFWQMANNLDDRQVKPKILPGQISRETSFEEDTADMTIILGTLQYLTERIAKKLREQELVCHTMAVKIGYSDFTRHTQSKSLDYPSNDGAGLFRTVNLIFDDLQFRRIRIRHVGVSVSHLEPYCLQGFLFDDRSRQESLNGAIDEIRHRFGFMALLPADTLELKRKYRMDSSGYILHNPALTR